MNLRLLLPLALLARPLCAATVDASTFGATPDDDTNDLPALRQALAAAVKQGNCTLHLPPGRYVVADAEAVALQDRVMSGAMGNPEKQLFNRDFKYVTALDFSGATNVTVEAKGAELMVDGWMEPVALQNCRGVTLNGLSIDYKRPPNSSGTILAVGDGTVDVKFADWCPVDAKTPFLRMMAFDEETKRFLGGTFTPAGVEVIAPQTLRFRMRAGQCRPGLSLVATHGFHFRPAILLYLAQDTTLNDVSIHAQPGMGVVGHMAENTVMNRLRVVPKPGRHMPCNTDATHFVSCRGLLRFDGCEFAGQGDDATNVHIFYTDILARGADNTCTMEIGPRFETHSVKRDFPRVGDRLAIVERKTLREVGEIEVESVVLSDRDFSCQIRYRGRLPDNIADHTLANISASARLEFVNCTVRSHRARSVLVKTRKVLIEGNTFDGCTGTCIHLGAEGDWMEGTGSSDVVIRDNVIRHCGTGGANDGTLEDASAVALHVKAQDRSVPGIHRRVLIENNRITGGRHAIAVRGSEDVTIRHNVFQDITADPVTIAASERVWSHDNSGAPDLRHGPAPALPAR